jgi:uncharacterized protein (TIGR00645 family)
MWRAYAEKTEHLLESIVFASRWLLAPFYLGLALSLAVLLVKFGSEFLHLALGAFTLSESDVILGVLALVDLALTGSLLIIVIFSGYENFVSKIDHSAHKDWPEWMGTIDFGALKLKLLSSIVAISAIQLLKQFMALRTVSPENERTLFWLVTIHFVFVLSSVLLALSDRIAGHGAAHAEALAGAGSGPGAHASPVMAAASDSSHTQGPEQGPGKGGGKSRK